MSASLLGKASRIGIDVKADPIKIDPERAVPFGLIVNELATNAIKHAFPKGTGSVVLSAGQIGSDIELIVADDGVGIQPGNVAKVPETRGADYVAIFVRQLGGSILVPDTAQAGTTVTVRFPLHVFPPSIVDGLAA